MRDSGPKNAEFRGALARVAFRTVGSVPSQKSPELQFLESVNARIVFAIEGNNLSLVQNLLPQVSTPKASELIEQNQLFLGIVRDGDTYLHLAVKRNKPVIFKTLLGLGFGKDLDIRNRANLKPGQYANTAIKAIIQQYQSKQAGKLGDGLGLLVATKLIPSTSSGQPPTPPAK